MHRTLVPLLLLAACATPSPVYLGTAGTDVMRDGRAFRVFLRPVAGGQQAQVIRRGWAGGRDHRPLIAEMVAAAEQVSGCAALPDTVEGDSGVLNLRLRCD